MDLDELQSVQSRERQTDSLQQLRATFYRDAADYVHSLEAERDRAAERADDPWNSPEVGRLNDDIDTAEQTVEAIYERRVGKIVKMASLAAADMPTEDEGLTDEEQKLFDRLVTAIEENRDHVFAILDGEAPLDDGPETAETGDPGATERADPTPAETVDPVPRPDPDTEAPARDPSTGASDDADTEHAGADGSEGADRPSTEAERVARGDDPDRVDAADLMAGDDGPQYDPDPATGGGEGDAEPAPDSPGGREPTERSDGGVDVADAGAPADATPTGETGDPDAASGGPSGGAGRDGVGAVDRTMVRITDDVGEIFGVDDRAYELTEDDVVTLPEPNAAPLVDNGAAERLD